MKQKLIGSLSSRESLKGVLSRNEKITINPNIEPLTVTENGEYKAPENIHGYNPVNVNVPNRYDEGYTEGYNKGNTDGYQQGNLDGYNSGYENGYQASQDSITLQEKNVTKNGTVTADEGYTGLSKVNVEVPERYNEGYTEGKQDGYNEGYKDGFDDNAPVVEHLEVTNNGTYTPSDDVDGFNVVSVKVPVRYEEGFNDGYSEGKQQGYDEGFQASQDSIKLQEKTTTKNGEVTADSGFTGLSKVNVKVSERYNEGYSDGYDNGFDEGVASVKLQTKTITENGEYTPDNGYSGFSKVNVSVTVPLGKEEQEKTVDITKNGTTEITPDEGKVLSKVTVNVDVPIPEGYIKPSGTKEITENGTHDVTEYSSVNVNVPSSGGDTTDNLGLLITQNLENVYSTVSGALVPYAFYENDGVKTIELPNIQYLKERCFYGCDNLTTLKLPRLVGYTYQYMAAGCSKLVDVDIHDSSYISSYSFQNCTSLKKLDLHKVETIGTNAFVGATKFETLILRTDAVPALGGTNAFANTKIKSGGTGYIYVPKALIEEYKSATNWSSFASQFRAIEDYPDITGGA